MQTSAKMDTFSLNVMLVVVVIIIVSNEFSYVNAATAATKRRLLTDLMSNYSTEMRLQEHATMITLDPALYSIIDVVRVILECLLLFNSFKSVYFRMKQSNR